MTWQWIFHLKLPSSPCRLYRLTPIWSLLCIVGRLQRDCWWSCHQILVLGRVITSFYWLQIKIYLISEVYLMTTTSCCFVVRYLNLLPSMSQLQATKRGTCLLSPLLSILSAMGPKLTAKLLVFVLDFSIAVLKHKIKNNLGRKGLVPSYSL